MLQLKFRLNHRIGVIQYKERAYCFSRGWMIHVLLDLKADAVGNRLTLHSFVALIFFVFEALEALEADVVRDFTAFFFFFFGA